MKWYAEAPAVRARQLLADAAVLASALLLVLLGRFVLAAVDQLGAPGADLHRSSTRLAASLSDASHRVGGVPLVGGALASPLDEAAAAARSGADAGERERAGAHRLALLAFLLVGLLPALVLVGRHARVRAAYAVEAAAAAGLRGDVELLATRAAASAPLRRLAQLGPDPVSRWRRGDTDAGAALAALELQRLGLRPPP